MLRNRENDPRRLSIRCRIREEFPRDSIGIEMPKPAVLPLLLDSIGQIPSPAEGFASNPEGVEARHRLASFRLKESAE